MAAAFAQRLASPDNGTKVGAPALLPCASPQFPASSTGGLPVAQGRASGIDCRSRLVAAPSAPLGRGRPCSASVSRATRGTAARSAPSLLHRATRRYARCNNSRFSYPVGLRAPCRRASASARSLLGSFGVGCSRWGGTPLRSRACGSSLCMQSGTYVPLCFALCKFGAGTPHRAPALHQGHRSAALPKAFGIGRPSAGRLVALRLPLPNPLGGTRPRRLPKEAFPVRGPAPRAVCVRRKAGRAVPDSSRIDDSEQRKGSAITHAAVIFPA